MKRSIVIFSAVSMCLSSFMAFAQNSDTLVREIESANAGAPVRTGNFTEVRKFAGKAEQSLEGVLTFDPKGTLSMKYSSPEGEFFIIASNTISMKRDGVTNQFDLSKNRPMKALADMLLSSFNGTLNSLAASSSSTISAEKTKDAVVVTLTAVKKAVKGYSRIVLKYNPKNFQLFRMEAEEFDGSITTYVMK